MGLGMVLGLGMGLGMGMGLKLSLALVLSLVLALLLVFGPGHALSIGPGLGPWLWYLSTYLPVSYTHLTLPTNRDV